MFLKIFFLVRFSGFFSAIVDIVTRFFFTATMSEPREKKRFPYNPIVLEFQTLFIYVSIRRAAPSRFQSTRANVLDPTAARWRHCARHARVPVVAQTFA